MSFIQRTEMKFARYKNTEWPFPSESNANTAQGINWSIPSADASVSPVFFNKQFKLLLIEPRENPFPLKGSSETSKWWPACVKRELGVKREEGGYRKDRYSSILISHCSWTCYLFPANPFYPFCSIISRSRCMSPISCETVSCIIELDICTRVHRYTCLKKNEKENKAKALKQSRSV